MRGDDPRHDGMFSYITPDARVRPDHPLRPIRRMTDSALAQLVGPLVRSYSQLKRAQTQTGSETRIANFFLRCVPIKLLTREIGLRGHYAGHRLREAVANGGHR